MGIKMRGLFLSFLSLLSMVLLLTGCNEQTSSNKEVKQPLTVELSTIPSNPKANELVTINLKVKQGNKILADKDVDKVTYKIWKQGSKKIKKTYKAKKDDKGNYYLKKKFKSNTVYYLQYTVKSGNQFYEETKKFSLESNSGNEQSEESHAHFHPEDGINVHLMKEYNNNSKRLKLIAHVTKDGSPFSNTNVHFEIWSSDNNKHLMSIKVNEKEEGEYVGESDTSIEKGTYTVYIQVENGSETELIIQKIDVP
ncbi:FixH family protein [Caldibacillus thermoamylovorans]|nr:MULTISPECIES: FixH family protein [Bacillaceae]MBU5343970.1 FixH family protein [Caldifermentibacillus hisashii]MCB5936605.1 FixH family protein [Bacillus sp. DFI.2.34]MCB7078038.1 FixH family protein [Caldibacillus thermoamylovorans]MCM3800078.1 FixH family protein [Caldibacillus thermoamylovorans]